MKKVLLTTTIIDSAPEIYDGVSTKGFTVLLRKVASKSAITPLHLDIINIIWGEMNNNNIFSSSKTHMQKTLSVSRVTLFRVYKILEECNFWYKDPSDSSRYFVNPRYYVKTKSDGYKKLLMGMYIRSKETNSFITTYKKGGKTNE